MATVHALLENNQMATTLADDFEIPVISGRPQAQGDLIVVPTRAGKSARAMGQIPADGIPLLRGRGGHTHLLVGAGMWTPGTGMELGTLTVPDGAEAFLIHEEHGAAGIGAGTYRVGRQQEAWAEIRAVAD